MSAPPSSLSELPHPRATGPKAALKSPAAFDSNRRRGHPRRRVTPAIPLPNWHLPEDRAHTSVMPAFCIIKTFAKLGVRYITFLQI
jgi:hypothetical protein